MAVPRVERGGESFQAPKIEQTKPSLVTTVFVASIGASFVFLVGRALHLPSGVPMVGGTATLFLLGGTYRTLAVSKKVVVKDKADEPGGEPAPASSPVDGLRHRGHSVGASLVESDVDSSGSGGSSPRSVFSGPPIDDEFPPYDPSQFGGDGVWGDGEFPPIDPLTLIDVTISYQDEEMPPELEAQMFIESEMANASRQALEGAVFRRKCARITLSILLPDDLRGEFQRVLDRDRPAEIRAFLQRVEGVEDQSTIILSACEDLLLPDDGIPSFDGPDELRCRGELVKGLVVSHFGLQHCDVANDGDCLFTALNLASGAHNLRGEVQLYLQQEGNLAGLAEYIRTDARLADGDFKGYPNAMKARLEAEGELYISSDDFLQDYRNWIGESYSAEHGGIWGSGVELEHILPNIIGKTIVVYSGTTLDGAIFYHPAAGPTEERVPLFYSENHYTTFIAAR